MYYVYIMYWQTIFRKCQTTSQRVGTTLACYSTKAYISMCVVGIVFDRCIIMNPLYKNTILLIYSWNRMVCKSQNCNTTPWVHIILIIRTRQVHILLRNCFRWGMRTHSLGTCYLLQKPWVKSVYKLLITDDLLIFYLQY